MEGFDLVCVCGHTRGKHNFRNTACDGCWDASVFRIPYVYWIHSFKLDNLKYLELFSKEKENV